MKSGSPLCCCVVVPAPMTRSAQVVAPFVVVHFDGSWPRSTHLLSLCDALIVTSQPKLRRSTSPRFAWISLPQFFVFPMFCSRLVTGAPTDDGIGSAINALLVRLS